MISGGASIEMLTAMVWIDHTSLGSSFLPFSLLLGASYHFPYCNGFFGLQKGWMLTSASTLHFQGAHNNLAMGLNMIFGFIHEKSSFDSSVPDLLCHFLFVNHLPFAELITFCFFPFHSVSPPCSHVGLGLFSPSSLFFTFLLPFSAPFLPLSLQITTFFLLYLFFHFFYLLPFVLWFILSSSVGTSNHRYP